MKKVILFLAIFVSCAVLVRAEEYIDFSVDSQIKSKYKTNAIEKDMLPPLPAIYNTEYGKGKTSVVTDFPDSEEVYKNIKSAVSSSKIPKGTQFKLYSVSNISSSTPKGTKISFESAATVTHDKTNIPAKTRFSGVVLDSHAPQTGGNGGLIVIMINEMVYQGNSYPINAQITKVNNQKVFFNNIKGKRGYAKQVVKSTQPGAKFMGSMWRTTCTLAKDTPDFILAPFSLALGVIGYGANVVVSPVLGIFSKGQSINIPVNSHFTVKLGEDAVFD